jgi:excisionase family DNA binding protein
MPTTDQTASGGLKSRAEAAEYLAMSRSRLDDLLRRGEIAAVRNGRSVRIRTSELERYINALPAYEPAS